MNKKLFFHLIALLLLQLAAPIFTYSQDIKKWGFGVSAGSISERFKVTRNFNQNQIVSAEAYKANSQVNFAGALWAERKLSPTLSLIPQFGYQIVVVNDNILSGGLSKSGSGNDIKETHHYFSVALWLRKYFILSPKLKLFTDAGVKADRLVRFKNEYWHYHNETWKPSSLNNINPAIILAAGVRRERWILSAEYQRFFGSPLVKKYRDNLEINGIEMNLGRQNLGVKVAFAIRK